MRIRTIKPEFWTNEKLCSLPECTHLFAAALLNYVDDEGYFNANPGLIKGALFPIRETSRTIPVMLQELSKIGYLKIGETDDERKYGFIIHFSEHQVINKPKESKIKCLDISWFATVSIPEQSGTAPTWNGMEMEMEMEGETGTRNVTTRARALDVIDDQKQIVIQRGKRSGKTEIDIDRDFDLFWEAYPKKVGKKDALKALQKARKSGCPKIGVLIAAIEKQRKSGQWRRDGGQYIPNPATWINRGQWDDIVADGVGRKLLPQEQSQLAIQEWLAEEEEKEKNGKQRDSGSIADDFGIISGEMAANKTNNASVVKDAKGHRPEIRTRGSD